MNKTERKYSEKFTVYDGIAWTGIIGMFVFVVCQF